MGELFCRLCGVVVGVGEWLQNKNNCFGSFTTNNNSRYIQISEDIFGSLCANAINNKFFANTIRYTLESDNATLEMQGGWLFCGF